jgi:hypothetical protein
MLSSSAMEMEDLNEFDLDGVRMDSVDHKAKFECFKSNSRNDVSGNTNLVDLIQQINQLSSSSASDIMFESVIDDWRSLLQVVSETGILILEKFQKSDKETLEIRLSHLSALSESTSLLAKLDEITDSAQTLPVIAPSYKTENTDSPVAMVISCIHEAQCAHAKKCDEINQHTRQTVDDISSCVRTYLDSVYTQNTSRIRMPPVEFCLTSGGPESLDLIRKTNSMRWLNDVLKWQVMDLNIQLATRARTVELQNEIAIKKDTLIEIVHERIRRISSLRMLEATKSSLDSAIDGLYRIAATSVSTSAASSPDAAPVQMMQSSSAKELDVSNEVPEMQRCVGF